MAITGHFSADFKDFERAVQQAEVSLRGFQADADKVQASVNRMGNAFSGQKIQQEAALAAKAVNDIGGVTKLTKEEQDKLNAVVTQALDKYKALGLQAPADLQKISAELNTQTMSWKNLAVAAGAIAGIVAGVAAGIGKLGERGAGVNDVRESFEGLTKAIGESSEAILGKLRVATLGTISDFELMQTANLGMSQGLRLTAEQFGTVGDVAAILADRTGGDLKNAFDTLTQAMATGQDRTLKTIGFNIDAAAATAAYAESIGKKVAELTEDERKQATVNAILAEGQKIIAQSGKAQKDFGDEVASSRTKLSNFIDSVGAWVATSPAVGQWTSVITAASGSISAVALAMGPVSAGLAKLIPLLGLTGVGGAFASLGTILTTSVLPALSATFLALAPFLVPLAALAAAVTGVYLAWKYWPEITTFVKGVYEGVRDWLGAKLQAVFDAVKAKVEAVTGYFKQMYEAVVGGSIVPDMVRGVLEWFARMGDGMVSTTAQATQQTAGIFQGLWQSLQGSLSGLNAIFQAAFEGGGGVGGAIKSFATTTVDTLLGMVPVVGPILSQFSGAFVAAGQKIWGAIQGMFGGPSAEERAGNKLADDFRASLGAVLTDLQRIEVQTLVNGGANRAWAESTVAIKDAYIEAGKTGEEALQVADRLWRAQKEGGDAVQRVIDEINMTMREKVNPAFVSTGTLGVESFERIHKQVEELHVEAIGSGQVGLLGAIAELERQIAIAAANGVTDFQFMTDAIMQMKSKIASEIVIPISVSWPEASGMVNRGEWTGLGRAPTEQDLEAFLRSNPGDVHRFEQAMIDAHRRAEAQVNIPGMHTGGLIDMAPWQRAHNGLKVDEVPIIAQTGEGVLSRTGMAALDRLNRGGGMSGRPIVIHNTMTIDGRVAARAIAEYLPSVLATMGVRAA